MIQPPDADYPEPLGFIFKEHGKHLALCDLLEEIADTLLDKVDRKKARFAADMLKYELPLHHRIEEEALFPMLMMHAAGSDNADEIITRLSEEHVVDESFAEELIEFLEQLAHAQPLEDANMFGYMLRGFFENYRRHVMWENSVVLPLAHRRLSAEQLRELACLIAELQSRHNQDQGAALFDPETPLCNGNCDDCKEKPEKPDS